MLGDHRFEFLQALTSLLLEFTELIHPGHHVTPHSTGMVASHLAHLDGLSSPRQAVCIASPQRGLPPTRQSAYRHQVTPRRLGDTLAPTPIDGSCRRAH